MHARLPPTRPLPSARAGKHGPTMAPSTCRLSQKGGVRPPNQSPSSAGGSNTPHSAPPPSHSRSVWSCGARRHRGRWRQKRRLTHARGQLQSRAGVCSRGSARARGRRPPTRAERRRARLPRVGAAATRRCRSTPPPPRPPPASGARWQRPAPSGPCPPRRPRCRCRCRGCRRRLRGWCRRSGCRRRRLRGSSRRRGCR